MTLHPEARIKYDAVTKEWFFNGEWYDYYPKSEIEEYEAMRDMAMEREK